MATHNSLPVCLMQGVGKQCHVAGALDGLGHITLLFGSKARATAGFDFDIAGDVSTQKSDIFIIDVI